MASSFSGRASAVGFAAVEDAGDPNGVFAVWIEEEAVVAAAETEVGARRFEFLHVALAVEQVAIEAVENLQSRFAIDGANIGARFRRPNDGDAWVEVSSWLTSSSRTRAGCRHAGCLLRDRATRARSRAAAVSGVISSSSTGARASERESGSTMTPRRFRTASNCKLFDQASKLPRGKQEKIVAILEPFIREHAGSGS